MGPNPYLDSLQLSRLELSFREWADSARRADVRLARRRILFIFLLIRYTGAKLNEVLALNPFTDIDPVRQVVVFGNTGAVSAAPRTEPFREVQISEALLHEIKTEFSDPSFRRSPQDTLHVDPGFVRRKFYERAQACSFNRHLGGPEMIRRARAEEIEQVTRFYVERESLRTTSARNAFFGKINRIEQGDIQAAVAFTTIGGYNISAIITNDSLKRLALRPGVMVRAEIKAPWLVLHKGEAAPVCSAENRFQGTITNITIGVINAEFIVRIGDGTELCVITTAAVAQALKLGEGDRVWAVFNSYAVVLHLD